MGALQHIIFILTCYQIAFFLALCLVIRPTTNCR